MNIIVVLCVGHDMLINKYSKAPVTTLVVKDRVTGHNPVGRCCMVRIFTSSDCRNNRYCGMSSWQNMASP